MNHKPILKCCSRVNDLSFSVPHTKSILKTTKLKPKKKLSFRDTIEDISYFVHTEAPIQVSNQLVYADRQHLVLQSGQATGTWRIKSKSQFHIMSSFNVILDQVYVDGSVSRIAVLVRNLAYHKKVQIRYTVDSWNTWFNAECEFDYSVCFQHDKYPGIDRFCAKIDLAQFNQSALKFEFAISYSLNNSEFWDNNGGQNYWVIHGLKQVEYECINHNYESLGGFKKIAHQPIMFKTLSGDPSETQFTRKSRVPVMVPYYAY